MSLRIAYIINQYPKVSHTFIRREILALERQGFEIQRIALRGWGVDLVDEADIQEREQTRYILQGGFLLLLWALLTTFLKCPMRFVYALTLAFRVMGRDAERPWPFYLAYFAEACRLLPWLKSSGVTHVHAHFVTNSTDVAMLAHALGGPPYSFTVHNGTGRSLSFRGTDEKIRRSVFVVAICSYVRSQIYRAVEHAHWSKVKVVHCGVDHAFYDVAPMLPPAAPRLVCVGRLCEQKGQLLLIQAAHRLALEGVALGLVLAGDGEMRADIEELIGRYGLAKQVRITGWISGDQVRAEILAARALVLPSFSEGLPVVIMEAMALRRPVLATYVGGISELVRPEMDGWLFPAGSIDDLTQAMKACLAKSVDDLQAMGMAAHRRVMERHSIDIEAAKLAELFRESSGLPVRT